MPVRWETYESLLEKLVSAVLATTEHARFGRTREYALLVVANGFAHLRNERRARETASDADAILVTCFDDSVHRCLTEWYQGRLESALNGITAAGIPRTVVERFKLMPNVERYKINRAREESPILLSSPLSSVGFSNALYESSSYETEYERAIRELRELPTSEKARIVAHHIESWGDPHYPCWRAAADLVILLELPEPLALAVLSVPLTLPDLQGLSVSYYCNTLFACAHMGYGEFLDPLVEKIRLSLTSCKISIDCEEFLLLACRALRRIGAVQELSALVDAISAHQMSERMSITVAALASFISQSSSELECDRLKGAIPSDLSKRRLGKGDRGQLASSIDVIRSIVVAASYGSRQCFVQTVLTFLPLYPRIADSLSTNTHYCLSTLHFVETIAMSIVDAASSEFDIRGPGGRVTVISYAFT